MGGIPLPRNKYPEETVQKILDASMKLFLEKGYEQTTVLDIVNSLGGLTRGAFYHHFKSKEEVLEALGDQLFYTNNPFDKVKERSDLNGLEKFRWVLSSYLNNSDDRSIAAQSVFLFQSPAFLKKLVDENRDILSPLFQELIEEGIRDGSIQTQFPKLLAELFTMFINFWMIPTIFPCTEEEAWQKFYFIIEFSEKMGLPVFNDEFIELCKQNIVAL
jgi:AcrR family transcriptional regulator